MEFERTKDLGAVRSILTHPAIYDLCGDDAAPAAEEFQPNDHPAIWYVLVRQAGQLLGVFVFIPLNAVCYEIHTAFLPEARGAIAGAAGRQIFPWMWANSPARRIVASAPAYNRAVIGYAVRSGMRRFGINQRSFLRAGTLHDQVLLGIGPAKFFEVSPMPSIVTSIIGGVQGSSAAQNAAATQAGGYNAAGQTIGNYTNTANNGLQTAANTWGQNVTNATDSASTGVNGAAGRAIDRTTGAVGTAANTLGSAIQAGQAGVANSAGTGAANMQTQLAQGQTGVNNAVNQGGLQIATQFNNGADQIRDAAQNGTSNVLAAAGSANSGLDPYSSAGAAAAQGLQSMANGTYDVSKDPGYQFRLQQGEQAVQRSAAARGGALGGAALKALTDYDQGAASQEYQNAFNRFTQTAGSGQAAAGQQGQNTIGVNTFGANLGANAANSTSQLGANAAGAIANMGNQAAQYNAGAGNTVAANQAQLGANAAQFNSNTGINGAMTLGNLFTGGAASNNATDLGAAQYVGNTGIAGAQYNSGANLNAAGQIAQNTVGAGQQIANTQIGASGATANGMLGSANAWNGMLTGIGQGANSVVSGGFGGGTGFSLGGALTGNPYYGK